MAYLQYITVFPVTQLIVVFICCIVSTIDSNDKYKFLRNINYTFLLRVWLFQELDSIGFVLF